MASDLHCDLCARRLATACIREDFMNSVYSTAEESATKSGYVGLVIDSKTYRVLPRTSLAYATADLAELAAKRLWEGRAATLATVAGLRSEVA